MSQRTRRQFLEDSMFATAAALAGGASALGVAQRWIIADHVKKWWRQQNTGSDYPTPAGNAATGHISQGAHDHQVTYVLGRRAAGMLFLVRSGHGCG